LTTFDLLPSVGRMEAEIAALDERLQQLIALTQRLRQDNGALRQQLAQVQDENKRLRDRASQARTRLEALVERLPEES
jgi:cell division protein ZapB